jgi:hypothetical protein
VAAGPQGLGGGQPVHDGHADVHQDHLRGVAVDHGQRLGAVAGLGEDAEVGGAAQHHHQAGRDTAGVHFRKDEIEGITLGEWY